MKRWVILPVLLLPLLLAACGGSSGDGEPVPSSTWDAMTWDEGQWA